MASFVIYTCRCVNNTYAVNSGTYQLIWNDAGLSADSDVVLWANRNTDSADGIDATTFTAFATHSTPTGKPNFLNGTMAKLNLFIPNTTTDQLAVIVYQVTGTVTDTGMTQEVEQMMTSHHGEQQNQTATSL